MSYDRKIDFVCPHGVVEEALFVANDRQIVRPLRPLVSAASVRLRLNGIDEIPSPGLFAPAEAIAAKKGPFSVLPATSQLVIKVNELPDQVVQITPGQRLTAQQVAKELNLRISGVEVGVSDKGRLLLRSQRTGVGATFMIRTTGSPLADVLGLTTNRQFRGRQTASGWSIIKDPNTVLRGKRLIMFDEPLPGFRDFVEVNYTTERSECRRCGGLGVENDWRYNVRGDVIEVRDEALLIQEIQKIMFTVRGTNTFHPWYGTTILNTVGQKLSAAGLIQSFIVGDIREAFKRWQSIKRQQEQDAGQYVSDEEFPFQLLQVTLTPSDNDPTILFVNSTIRSRSQRQLQLERGIRLPLPDDILGSTAQDGLIRQSLQNPVGFNVIGSGSGTGIDQGQFQGVFAPSSAFPVGG